ncbi:hypothetical protein EHQ59_04175 [Leptospira kemamanensis]|uniref:Lipoprotein n=1 Tax=Leptospira kemamanensis TaxID=2484942 RepID=A0A4R9JUJ3_9LEPT|nr:hypothetical protein EHQ59_04175 [Leptospira kemamanensis]
MRFISFSFYCVLLTCGCSEISREAQIKDECEITRNNSYLYMIPILQRHAPNGATETNSLYWVGNTELSYQKCISESKKNQFNLRSN